MGKTQKKKAMRRHNPMRVPDAHLPAGLAGASASAPTAKMQAVLPILQKMQAADAVDRKWACVAVSNLIQNDPATRRLLQGKNVVGELITRLSDTEDEVVVEAAGALRNLCIDGGYELCGEMFNKNVLAPLRTFIPKISTTLQQYLENPKSAPENAKRLVYELAENVITILWCLSETSHKALNAINELQLVPFLLSFLSNAPRLAPGPVAAAAQCLYVLTDDNAPAARAVRADGAAAACLVSLARDGLSTTPGADEDPRTVTIRVLAVGVLRNVAPFPPAVLAAHVDLDSEILLPLLQPIISSISLPNTCTAVQEQLAKEAALPAMEKLSIKGTPKSDHKSAPERELERIEQKLRTVQLSLEILTSVCATLPDPEPPTQEEEGEDDEEPMDDDDMDGDAAEPDDEDAADTLVKDEAMVSEASQANGNGDAAFAHLSPLLPPLLALIQPTLLSFPPVGGGASVHAPTTAALGSLHVCALECLHNLVLGLATRGASVGGDKAAGAQVWAQVWAALDAVGAPAAAPGPGQERRGEMWETAAGVLWGVAGIWKGGLEPQEGHVQLLMQLCDATTDDGIRVKCIGALECLAQNPNTVGANGVIAAYLMDMLPSGSAPSRVGTEALMQAVSGLIDIYSDERLPYDVNFRTQGFLQRLAGAVDGVKRAAKAVDRKQSGGRDLKARAEETRDNLVAFIRYRRGLKL